MTNPQIDPAFGTEQELDIKPVPSLAELKDTLKSNKHALEAQIANAVEERSRLNAQLAEDRAELTKRADERRNDLNEQIRESREQLKDTLRLLKATEGRKPKKATDA